MKTKYKVTNWPEYNEALKNRGSLEVWIDESVKAKWYVNIPEGKRKKGAQPIYTDFAITVTLQFGKVFHQRLRQTEGLLTSTLKVMDIDLEVPDYTTLSKRGERPRKKQETRKSKKKEKKIIIVDSTGLKVYGEGEWKVRKHGHSKRRTWRKAHLAITPDHKIHVSRLTRNNISDEQVFPELVDEISDDINTVSGDGAYDKTGVYDKCLEKNVNNILIPPQKNAKIWQHGNCKDPPHPRDENLRQIRKSSLNKWKEDSGYHIRSLGETAMFRLKTILGDRLNARKFVNQVTESQIMLSILNKMTDLGMPKSIAVQ